MDKQEFECFARHIRAMRTQRHLTQEELADKIGLSRQSIYSIETGRCLPSLDIAMDLAKFFDRTFDDFFATDFFADDVDDFAAPAINIKENEKEINVSIPLPTEADGNKIKAKIKNNTLSISIPKKK